MSRPPKMVGLFVLNKKAKQIKLYLKGILMASIEPLEENQARQTRKNKYIHEITEKALTLLKETGALIVKISKGGELFYGDVIFSLESLIELTLACIESYAGNNTYYVFVAYKLNSGRISVEEFTGKDILINGEVA